jgi:hypothetical protein
MMKIVVAEKPAIYSKIFRHVGTLKIKELSALPGSPSRGNSVTL